MIMTKQNTITIPDPEIITELNTNDQFISCIGDWFVCSEVVVVELAVGVVVGGGSVIVPFGSAAQWKRGFLSIL